MHGIDEDKEPGPDAILIKEAIHMLRESIVGIADSLNERLIGIEEQLKSLGDLESLPKIEREIWSRNH